MDQGNPLPARLTRREMLAASGAATASAALLGVAGCATYSSGSATAGSGGAGAGGTVLGPTSDVPVGGGKVFDDQSVVVTQPKAGTFQAFDTTCPHAGCAVNTVTGGTINCPCHGSKFRVADGSVAHGPATRPLTAKGVTSSGGQLRLS